MAATSSCSLEATATMASVSCAHGSDGSSRAASAKPCSVRVRVRARARARVRVRVRVRVRLRRTVPQVDELGADLAARLVVEEWGERAVVEGDRVELLV